MKQRAILYTRVSTDEQNNGYSPLDQKDKLYRYSQNNQIEVVGFYHDDESAKTFDRPEWNRIITFLKQHKGIVNKLYFVKWDRFSRNVAEAYIAIRELKKLGVEPQAIEQPLDFEIPESKIMLAVYLAAPEVDNDRRALNIFNGIRRGKKEGRWLGGCPIGYKNARNAENKPVIVPEEGKKQKLVMEAFEFYSKGTCGIEELRLSLRKKGLKCSRNSFWRMLRNRVYIGKIFVPAYKDEPGTWVNGLHEPIIEEALFYEVQDILEGRKRKLPSKYKTNRIELPLRGYLICPRCGSNLTGSASKGRWGGRFFYYHCSKGCKERQSAKRVNATFEALLQSFSLKPKMLELGGRIIKERFKDQTSTKLAESSKIFAEIEKNRVRLKNAQVLMLDGELDAGDYKALKQSIEEEINNAQVELSRMSDIDRDILQKIDGCIDLLKNLGRYYTKANVALKQRIVGSIFPGRLIFEDNRYRTPLLNEAVAEIFRIGAGLGVGTKKKHTEFGMLSLEVVL